MGILLLSPGAELCINAMRLQKKDEDRVRKCVSRYSQPKSFSGALAWLVFRTVNAFKSIFGKSDWQVSKKILHNQALTMAKEQELFQAHPKNKLQTKIKDNVTTTTKLITSQLLNLCLLANQNQVEVDDKLEQQINRLDLENALEKIEVVVEKFID